MSELRWDRLRGLWAIVAPERRGAGGHRARGRKPPPAALPTPEGPCPFCPGHERRTQNERLREPLEGPWKLRVVDNRFPILGIDSEAPEGAYGRHEVLIEHPSHDLDLADLGAEEIAGVLGAVRARVSALSALEEIAEVVFFRNRGAKAGSSQPHPHSQIVALPRVSNERARRMAQALAHMERTGASLLRAVLEEEVLGGPRQIARAPGLVAYCPLAPQRPGLIRVAPERGEGRFADLGGESLRALAELLGALLRAQREVSGGGAYNLLLHEPPVAQAPGPACFWVLEIVPRSSGWAGFELATGVDILLEAPEQSAEDLRAALSQDLPAQGMPKLPGA